MTVRNEIIIFLNSTYTALDGTGRPTQAAGIRSTVTGRRKVPNRCDISADRSVEGYEVRRYLTSLLRP